MSADNRIIINRKTLKAYYGQADNYNTLIAEGKTLDEVVDKVQKWIKKQEDEAAEDGYYFILEYGIKFI